MEVAKALGGSFKFVTLAPKTVREMTHCSEGSTVRGRIEEMGFQFYSQSNFDSNFQAYDIVIAARVHYTAGARQFALNRKVALILRPTSSQELRIDFTAFAQRPYFCN